MSELVKITSDNPDYTIPNEVEISVYQLSYAVRDLMLSGFKPIDYVSGVFIDGENRERTQGRLNKRALDILMLGVQGARNRLLILSPKSREEYTNSSNYEFERTLEALVRKDPSWALGKELSVDCKQVQSIENVEYDEGGNRPQELGREALIFAKVEVLQPRLKYPRILRFLADPSVQLKFNMHTESNRQASNSIQQVLEATVVSDPSQFIDEFFAKASDWVNG